MPREVRSEEEFRKLIEKASECRVVRRGEKVKLKLRTPKVLYTFVTTPEVAERILKEIKLPVLEF